MQTYALIYDDDGSGVGQTIQFEAFDPAAALWLAHKIEEGRVGLLTENGNPLCRLQRQFIGDADVWIVAPARPAPLRRHDRLAGSIAPAGRP